MFLFTASDNDDYYYTSVIPRNLLLAAACVTGLSWLVAIIALKRLYRNTKLIVVMLSAMTEFFGGEFNRFFLEKCPFPIRRVARNLQWGWGLLRGSGYGAPSRRRQMGIWKRSPQPPEARGLGAVRPAPENFLFFG